MDRRGGGIHSAKEERRAQTVWEGEKGAWGTDYVLLRQKLSIYSAREEHAGRTAGNKAVM